MERLLLGLLRRLGAALVTVYEDHFLFFSQPDAVLDQIATWLEEID